MIYLQDAKGNVVRALEASGENLIFIQRHDTRRVETCQDLSFYDKQKIKYTVLETVETKIFQKATSYTLKTIPHLKLVKEAYLILPNTVLPEDDSEKFNTILKKTSIGGLCTAVILFTLNFFIKPNVVPPAEEPEIVQVLDRKQIQQMIVTPSKTKVAMVKKPIKNRVVPRPTRRAKMAQQQSGVLGVLGSLKTSRQQGGLKLSNADTSSGIGRGGSAGSGGVQTSTYSKGMFSSPLGTGGKVNGAGGYGTKGKGGGQAGYGQVSLVGAGGSYFQAVESEAWVEGGLDRNEIAAVINRHISEVRYCYEKGLQSKPSLSGRLSMKFYIGPKGSVTLAQVANSSLGHAAVENCIQNRLKTWQFPQPQGGVTVKVSYPFVLRRVSDT